MLSANFKPKRIAAASRGFLAIARLSCCNLLSAVIVNFYEALRSCTSPFDVKLLIPLTGHNVMSSCCILITWQWSHGLAVQLSTEHIQFTDSRTCKSIISTHFHRWKLQICDQWTPLCVNAFASISPLLHSLSSWHRECHRRTVGYVLNDRHSSTINIQWGTNAQPL